MSDWADEKAFQVAQDIWNEPPQDTIAAALRAARNEALEEAAKALALVKLEWLDGKTTKALKAGFVESVFVDADHAIRALKDKQP